MTTTLIVITLLIGTGDDGLVTTHGPTVTVHDFQNKEMCEQAKQIVMNLARGHGSADRQISAHCMEQR